jgi:CubicO group peptidase (beta-lactamase class C family)
MRIDPARLEQVDAVVRRGLEQRLYSATVYALVRSEEVTAVRAFGWLGEARDSAAPGAAALDSLFDLASLTKPVATAASMLALAEDGALHLEEPVGRFLPVEGEDPLESVTLRHLLTHSSGLPAWRRYHSQDLPREEIVRRVRRTERERPIGARFVYSDLGYILLGEVVEAVAGQGLAEFARRRLFEPLGMQDTGFLPGEPQRDRIAATRCPDRERVLVGEVHDGNAAAMGGVAGHAGLFGTAPDLARFARMLLRGGQGEGRRVLGPLTVAAMGRNALPAELGGCGLGWFTRPNGMLPVGDFLPGDAFGHTGFTGTSMVVVPSLDLAAVWLTNRVYSESDGGAFLPLRRRFHNAVAGALV